MFSENHQFVLMLDSVEVSKNKILKFYKDFCHEDNLFLLFENHSEIFKKYFSEKDIILIKNAILSKIWIKTAQKLQKQSIFCVFYDDDNYPQLLKNISNPPVVLYYIGDIKLFMEPCIAIVGSRTPTRYGKEVTEIFTRSLVRVGVVTVSGLAYGVDGLVASSTLDEKGKTIAVLAGGLDNIYPSSHAELARKIVKTGGLLVSEFLPGVKPQKHFFLERNRIIAGASIGMLITEAGEGSGTMSTARYAIDYGRELFVVPGNITSDKSAGSNKLISEIPDCFTISPAEIIDRLGIADRIKINDVNNKIKNLDTDEIAVIDAIGDDEVHFDDLVEMTKFHPQNLATLLTRMEINGLIKKLSGNFYAVNKKII